MASASNFVWESFPQMPTKRVYSSITDVDGLLYVIGGCDIKGTALDSFECYNPKKKKWLRLLNMPTSRASPAVVTVGKKIVVIGGLAGRNEPTDKVEVYDVVAKCWNTGCKPLGEKLQGVSAVVHRGNPIVVGGMRQDTNPTEVCSALDLEENIWRELPSLPTPRYATAVHLIEDKLYVLGGRQAKIPCHNLEVLDLAASPTPSWTVLKELPIAGTFPSIIMTDAKFYVLGGLQRDVLQGFHDEVQEYDVEKGEWVQLPVMPHKRADFCAGIINGKIIVVGGITASKFPLQDVECYDSEVKTWQPLPKLSSSRGTASRHIFQGKLLVAGGFSTSGLSGLVELIGPR